MGGVVQDGSDLGSSVHLLPALGWTCSQTEEHPVLKTSWKIADLKYCERGMQREETEKWLESKWNHAAAQLASWKEGAQPLFPGSERGGSQPLCRNPQSGSPIHSPCSIGQGELVVIGSSWAGNSAHTIPGTEQVLCHNTCREVCPSLCQWNMGAVPLTQTGVRPVHPAVKLRDYIFSEELWAESRTGSAIVPQGKGSILLNLSTGEEPLPRTCWTALGWKSVPVMLGLAAWGTQTPGLVAQGHGLGRGGQNGENRVHV